MKWIKRGLLFCPDNNYDWMVSHASNPVGEPLGGGVIRVYFSCRDKKNRSSIGFLDFDIQNAWRLLGLASEPLIGPGEPGLFDDSGASIGCVVAVHGKKYIYYVGWNLAITVPWRNSIGLAVSEDGLTFTKYSRAPIMDRSDVDPFSISYPSVLQDGAVFKMWYGSNLNWGPDKADVSHVIKMAESKDGIDWVRRDEPVLTFRSADEYALARPCVIKEGGVFKMWYSYRGTNYRIGYAESEDGLVWERRDGEVGIGVSDSGWDSEMIEYPHVFDCSGVRYMLYNGNGYGRTGFGLAVME